MEDKLRVLMVCQEDPAWILGGMGRHVGELGYFMAKRDDVEVELLTSGRGEGSEEWRGFARHLSDKLICRKPQQPNMNALRLADFQLAKTLARLLAEGKRWDLVHIHEWNSVEVGRMVRDALKVPMVGTLHLCLTKLSQFESCPTDQARSEASSEEWSYMLQQEAHLAVDSDRFIVCSRAYEQIARECFLTRRKIDVIYNGIDCEVWSPDTGSGVRARATHNLPPKPVALFVGRIADMKGIRVLLDAIESAGDDFIFVIVGEVNADTQERADAWDVTQRIKRIESEQPQRLRWVKFQSGQALRDLYAAAHAVIMPSIHEPFGIVALEAMAMGTPLIATEVDGLGEIVNDEQGNEYAFIIDPGRPDHIVEGLTTLLDAEKRAALSSAGLKRVDDFDWRTVAEQTAKVYKEVTRRE